MWPVGTQGVKTMRSFTVQTESILQIVLDGLDPCFMESTSVARLPVRRVGCVDQAHTLALLRSRFFSVDGGLLHQGRYRLLLEPDTKKGLVPKPIRLTV